MSARAIDLWVNVTMGEQEPPEFLVRVKEDYFKGGDDFFQNIEPDKLIADMDEAGVERAVVTLDASNPSKHALRFAAKYPGRVFYSASLRPTGRMREVWALKALAANEPVVMARVVPFSTDVPPSHPNYYPLYVKLPELKICMAHGADPWWSVAIRLMIKYKNLHLMTSAYAPKYLPAELIHFMNTRGQDKILFASDHPVLSFKRCVEEAKQLDLRPGVLDKYLRANAERLFFSPRKPH
jgi:predicted TIM-barrel fold metal-dependent hydrolase